MSRPAASSRCRWLDVREIDRIGPAVEIGATRARASGDRRGRTAAQDCRCRRTARADGRPAERDRDRPEERRVIGIQWNVAALKTWSKASTDGSAAPSAITSHAWRMRAQPVAAVVNIDQSDRARRRRRAAGVRPARPSADPCRNRGRAPARCPSAGRDRARDVPTSVAASRSRGTGRRSSQKSRLTIAKCTSRVPRPSPGPGSLSRRRLLPLVRTRTWTRD